MIQPRSALVIGTEVALNGFESGASLRIEAIRKLLEDQGYSTTLVARSNAKPYLNKKWDAIALTSFSTAKFARRARKITSILWFDSTDSWSQTRFSLINQGYLLQMLAYLRDLLFVWTSPYFDLITFITERDRHVERIWWKWRTRPLVFPVLNLDQEVINSTDTRLVFIGDGNYLPNQQAVKYLENVVSKLPTNLPIHIFGRGYDSTCPQFIYHGYVTSDKLYQANDIHLAPIFSGAGLKLKVAVPAWNGLRVVTTPEGANGLNTLNHIAIAKTPLEFVQKIQDFLTNPVTLPLKDPRETIFEVDESSLIVSQLLGLS